MPRFTVPHYLRATSSAASLQAPALALKNLNFSAQPLALIPAVWCTKRTICAPATAVTSIAYRQEKRKNTTKIAQCSLIIRF